MSPSLSLSSLLFGLYLIIIVFALRITKTISPAILVCGCAILTYIFGLILIGIVGWRINFFSFSSLYWFLTLNILMVFGAVYKSISLRMMLHLLNKPKRTGFYDAILDDYIKSQSYTNRIAILLEKKMIENSGNTFTLTKKGTLFARRLWLIQQIFSIKESG